MVAGRLKGLEAVAVQLGMAVDDNKDNPIREFIVRIARDGDAIARTL